MNERDFVYWLNGFVELTPDSRPSADQWLVILEHLALVMTKASPKGTPSVVAATPVSQVPWPLASCKESDGVPVNVLPFQINPTPLDAQGQWLKNFLEQKQREVDYPPLGTPYPRPGDIYC